MRRLSNHDLVLATRVVKDLNVTEEIKALALNIGKTATMKQAQQIGFRLFFAVLSNIGSEQAEKDLFQFLSGPLECDPEELVNADALETAEKIKELVGIIGINEWKGFFKSLASMMN